MFAVTFDFYWSSFQRRVDFLSETHTSVFQRWADVKLKELLSDVGCGQSVCEPVS